MILGIANDHAGYQLKIQLLTYLKEKGIEVTDFGSSNPDPVDYPDFAHLLAKAVEDKEVDLGISICGSGNGINITANKHQGVRSALCWNKEISRLARLHNDANIVALPARFISVAEAYEIVDTFLTTPFEGGRHCARVEKIPVK
ncbi:MAG: ribose 5-phosphate isomerase B [Bacteroidota bacterium]|jgi:ribose 5-phosphate isomerase B|nr:ribose 5-phosphate isomerase B [Bacteroidota bacterium]